MVLHWPLLFQVSQKYFLRLVLCLYPFTVHSAWRVQLFLRISSYYFNGNIIFTPFSNWFSDPNFQLLDISIKYTYRLILTKYVPKPAPLLCFLFWLILTFWSVSQALGLIAISESSFYSHPIPYLIKPTTLLTSFLLLFNFSTNTGIT